MTLFDDEGVEQLTETVPLKVGTDGMLVGLLDIDGVDTAVRSATTTPLERRVLVIPVTADDIGPRMAPLEYLVVGPGALADLEPDTGAALTRWVKAGGRLIGPATEVVAVAEPGSGQPFGETGLVITRFGSGEIGVADNLASLDGDTWSRVLRDRPNGLGAIDQSRGDASAALVSAASAGQEASVPALPWLLAGIVVFILLVGPVNIVVLRWMGRPEWAWLTVPALSLVFLGLFWGIGRSQISDFSASYAAVVVDDGSGATAHGGFLLQVADGGTHTLALPDGWEAAPTAPGLGAGLKTGTVTDAGVEFDLPSLGLGSAEMRWPDEVDVTATITVASDGLVAAVTNDTPWTMWAWGVVVNGVGYNGEDTLPPGSSQTIDIPAGLGRIGFDPVIAEAVSRRPFDANRTSRTHEVVYPLASHLEQADTGIRSRGAYVFGLTTDRTFPLSLGGRSADSAGTTLLVRRIEVSESDVAGLGGVRAELLSVDGASSVERYGDEIYAYGAEAVYLVYSVPEVHPDRGTIDASFTGFDRVEMFDWQEGAFRTFDPRSAFTIADATSAGGEVIVRASVTDDSRFFDQSISLQRYALKWSDT